MAGLLGLAAMPVVGQDGSAGMQEEIEQIVVIGSRIPVSTPKDGTSPVQIITAEEIARSGLTDLGALLQELPGAGAALNLTYNNGGDGSIRLDFRNLGTSRTLVLVDGRRWIVGGEGANSSVDVNTIPLGMVERIEVLKDGASSIYGSDAIAAVVNIVTRSNFDGALFTISQGAFEAGGGETKKVEALFGVDGDRGNVTLGLTWVNNLAVGNAERDETAARPTSGGSSGTPQGRFSYSGLALPEYRDNDDFLGADYIKARTSDPLGAAVSATYSAAKGGSHRIANLTRGGEFDPTNVANMASVLYGNFANLPKSPEANGSVAVGGFTPKSDFGGNGFNTSALTGTQPGDFETWHGGANGWGFNYNPANYVVTPNERRSVFMNGNFEINDNHSATFKALYQNRRSDQLLAPTPLFWGFSGGQGISASNAFNTLGVEFCAAGDAKSAYGDKESCTQKSHFYYTFGGNLKAIPGEFYKNGDTFGGAYVKAADTNKDYEVTAAEAAAYNTAEDLTGDDAIGAARVAYYLYNRNEKGERTSARYPVAANANCSAAGAPIGTNTDVTKCSRYSDAYLDKDGNLEYAVSETTTGTGDDATTTAQFYRATPGSGSTAGTFTVSSTAVAANTDIYADFILNDVAKKDKDGNVIYSTANVPKPGHAVGWLGRRMLEYGPRNFLQDIETFHVQAGVEGTFDVGTFEWSYDVDWSWSQVQAYSRTEGLLNTSRVAKALGPSAENAAWKNVKAADSDGNNKVDAAEATAYNTAQNLTGDDAIAATDRFTLDDDGNIACADSGDGCVSLNIFGGQGTDAQYLGGGLWGGSGSMTSQMLRYISFTAQDTGSNTQKLITANVAGNVVDLPAGPLGVAAGLEYRDSYGNDQPDALIDTGQTSGNARSATRGGYDVTEYYVEAKVPVVANLPGVQLLDVSLSARSSDFSTFGGTTTDKVALGWEINDMFKIRMTQATGYRAPTVPELFLGLSDSYPDLQDPCAATIAGNTNSEYVSDFSNCAAAGVPTGFDQPNTQIRITVGGNKDLLPEKSESFTYGVIIEPMDTIQITLDFWNIEITDAIATLGAQSILNRCFDPGDDDYNPGLTCGLVDRASDGSVSDLRDFAVNVSSIEVSGYDIALVYDINDQWFVSADATYIEEYAVTGPTGVVTQSAGRIGSSRGTSTPRVKGRVYTRFDSEDGRWSWTNELNYIHSVLYKTSNRERLLDAIYYWDTALSYDWERINTSLSFGLENIMDQDPTYFPETFANDFDPSYRMWGSRRWVAGARHYID